ncbi:hypothetical protein [Frankia sp. CiP3]|uniref:hypothetical protein n=1 Tax=Frankia sp. CiP3 TaxID=2880971 RepID=UPI001EF4140B|nr:hypothetical protein [Frankia sp. CiP3]
MVNAFTAWELADVHDLGLDQLRDSPDEALRTEVGRLLDSLAREATVWEANGCGQQRRPEL